jgi:hypothetical protein
MRGLSLFALLAGAVPLSACGSSQNTNAPATSTRASSTHAVPTTQTTPSALQAEATSAAAGDIPDNQVFIGFRDSGAGYSMKYPEGWAEQGAGVRVTFRDKNNIVRIVVRRAAPPTAAVIRRELTGLAGARVQSGPKELTVGGSRAFKAVYSSQSAPNPVTGKRVTLVVDRYYLFHAGKEAIVDLGTPVGVDNVDAYRLMIQSFRWK